MDYVIKGVNRREYNELAAQKHSIIQPVIEYFDEVFIPEKPGIKPDFKYNPETGEVAIFFETGPELKPAFDDFKLTSDEKIAANKIRTELLYILETSRRMKENWF